MTDEEKKTIDKLKNGKKYTLVEIIRVFKEEGIENFRITRKEYLDTILNLIEKQSKEIEELKIEEALQEKFSKLKFIVKFVKIKKTYEIKVGNINIFYSWDDTLTFERNIEYIIIYLKLLGGIK